MATRKRKDVEAAITQKGFVLEKSGDHRYYHFLFNNRRIARTKVSHGTKYKDLSDDLLSHMANQCHLTMPEFLQFVDCPLSQQGYEGKLRERHLLE